MSQFTKSHLLRQPFWLIHWLILKGLACLFDRRQAEPNRWFSLEPDRDQAECWLRSYGVTGEVASGTSKLVL